MNVRVIGLWHMGTVVSACLASVGHDVVGLDHDAGLIGRLLEGRPPVYEPGLDTLLREGLSTGRLAFTSNENEALDGAEVVWITFDTPVDEDDHADVKYVEDRVTRIFPQIPNGGLVLISSQVPVGTTRHLEERYQSEYPENRVSFVYAPENLRLGNAIASFKRPDRVVIGLRTQEDRSRITSLFRPFTDRIEWMSVESAEFGESEAERLPRGHGAGVFVHSSRETDGIGKTQPERVDPQFGRCEERGERVAEQFAPGDEAQRGQCGIVNRLGIPLKE